MTLSWLTMASSSFFDEVVISSYVWAGCVAHPVVASSSMSWNITQTCFFPEHHHLRSCWNLLFLFLPREHGGRFPDAAAPAPAPQPCPWPWARAPALEPAIISCSCSAVSWMIPCGCWSGILATSVKLLVSTYPFSGSTLYHNTVNLKKTDESLT